MTSDKRRKAALTKALGRQLKPRPSPQPKWLGGVVEELLVALREHAAVAEASGRREDLHGYLAAVYGSVFELEKRGYFAAALPIIAVRSGIKIRRNSAVFGVLLVATSAPNKQTLSRWSKVLHLALGEGVRPTKFKTWLAAQGGINACAAANKASARRAFNYGWFLRNGMDDLWDDDPDFDPSHVRAEPEEDWDSSDDG